VLGVDLDVNLTADAAPLLLGGLAAGLAAGSASCTAAQGGLLVALTGPAPRTTGSPRAHHAPDRAPAGGPRLIAAFAAGRLVTHVLAGALLGLLGGAVRLGPTARAVLLIAAGAFVVGHAVRLIRRARRRRHDPACGDAAARAAEAGRTPGTGRALALGAATVLVPCGVTLSVEAAAVSIGSAAGGALLMAGFVAGSTPAFAVLGLLLRRVAATRFATVAGVVAVAAGLWTAASGLRLAGWLPDGAPPASAAAAEVRADGVQAITIWATAEGYRPGVVTLRAGVPAELTFRVTGDAGCTRTVTIEGRDTALPATVRLPPRPPGRLRYVCGMGMYPGFLYFR